MSSFSFHVSKLSPELVVPSEPTPSVKLPLSRLDPKVGEHMEVILVFRHGHGPANAVKEALSKALVPYYPVAGRIVAAVDYNETLHVDCTGDGVWFVEASADCSLEDVDFLENHPIMIIPKENLLPSPPPQIDEDLLIFIIQVTEFKHGGFVVGVKFHHKVLDGIGAAQFTRTIGDIAAAAAAGGGVMQPTFKPIWSRDVIPSPSPARRISPPDCPARRISPPDLPVACQPVEYAIDFSHDQIRRMQDRFFDETGKHCSTFDVLTAKLWQSRIRAIGVEPDASVSLASPADLRRLLLQEVLKLEGDYYGNCVYHIAVSAQSGRIAQASLVEVVDLVKEAKENLATRLSKWLKRDPEEDPWILSLSYTSTHLADWRRIGFGEVDYGWGRPVSIAPLNGQPRLNFLLKSPLPKKGVRLMTWSIAKEHMEAFQNERSFISFWNASMCSKMR